MLFIDITLIAVLSIIVFQDFKDRAISIWCFPLLLISIILVNLKDNTFLDITINALINSFVLSVQIVIITIYFSIKKKRLYNIIDKQIGIGDIIFIISLGFLFKPAEFVTFLTASYILILVIYFLSNKYFSRQNKLIPLAGGVSAFLIILWIYRIIFSSSPITDLSYILYN